MTIPPRLLTPLPASRPPEPTSEERATWRANAAAAAEKAAARAAGPLYQVEANSLSMHDCCFAATVVRTDLPNSDPEASICETHDVETAQRIADLLNAANNREPLTPDRTRKHPRGPGRP